MINWEKLATDPAVEGLEVINTGAIVRFYDTRRLPKKLLITFELPWEVLSEAESNRGSRKPVTATVAQDGHADSYELVRYGKRIKRGPVKPAFQLDSYSLKKDTPITLHGIRVMP